MNKKKESMLQSVNHDLLSSISPEHVKIKIIKIDEAELDEMWSFVSHKGNPRWLWHAIDKDTGKILAYTFGYRKDEVFLKLKHMLKPFGIKYFYTDDWGAYDRNINECDHIVGKRGTQKIERKHLTLRTRIKRLARKTICFSKTVKMHDIVIGIFINFFEFNVAIS